MSRALNSAGEIDAWNHWEAAHHRRLPGDGQPILIIEGRPLDGHGDVAVHQVGFIEIGETNLRTDFRFLDDDRFESGHALTRWQRTDDRGQIPQIVPFCARLSLIKLLPEQQRAAPASLRWASL